MRKHACGILAGTMVWAMAGCQDNAPDLDGDGYDRLSDCDDTDRMVYPGAMEICQDGIDQDCSGSDLVDCFVGEADADGDGFNSVPFEGTDCDDSSSSVYPGAKEILCDGIDQDCDGADISDQDGDGERALECGGMDCDDLNPNIHPRAIEIAYDGIDQNCDELPDSDQDGDGYDAEIVGGGDCNDEDAGIHPDAVELAGDSTDQNCDGFDDPDVDGDGFSAPVDCEDTAAEINPEALEISCNDADENCDGLVADADCDGDASLPIGTDCDDSDSSRSGLLPEQSCNTIDENCDGWVADADCDGQAAFPQGYDCNDEDASIIGAATETSCNAIDENCDGIVEDEDCDGSSSLPAGGDDCDDHNAFIHVYATEYVNGLDDNCDGEIDERQDVDDARAVLDGDVGSVAGSALATGDFNGDGLDDIAIGAPDWRNEQGVATGAVFVLLGSETGLSDTALSDIANLIIGTASGDRFGSAIDLGDVNRDGIDDLIVGAPGALDAGRNRTGAVYALQGGSLSSRSDASSAAMQTIFGHRNGDEFGASVAVVGDVNGDSWNDLVVGAPGTKVGDEEQAGAGYLYLGGTTWSSYLDAAFTFSMENEEARTGSHVAALGDLNRDSLADFAISADGMHHGDGEITIFFGTAGQRDWLPGSQVGITAGVNEDDDSHHKDSDSEGMGLGPIVGQLDLNADGALDLVIGAPGFSHSTGVVYVQFGPIDAGISQLDVLGSDTSFVGEDEDSRFGAVLRSGFYTDDLFSDLLVGAPKMDNSRGGAYLLTGHTGVGWGVARMASKYSAASWKGAEADQKVASSLVMADINGDGWSDLACGAPGDNSAGSGAGAVYAYVW